MTPSACSAPAPSGDSHLANQCVPRLSPAAASELVVTGARRRRVAEWHLCAVQTLRCDDLQQPRKKQQDDQGATDQPQADPHTTTAQIRPRRPSDSVAKVGTQQGTHDNDEELKEVLQLARPLAVLDGSRRLASREALTFQVVGAVTSQSVVTRAQNTTVPTLGIGTYAPSTQRSRMRASSAFRAAAMSESLASGNL